MALEQEIRELEKRFAEAPESRLFLPLADALSRAGELERAVEICSRGLESFPDFTSARVLLGQCLARMDRGAEAAEILESVLKDDTGNLEALRTLGEIAVEQGDAGRARELYGRALEAEPTDEALAAALERLESRDEADGSSAGEAEEASFSGAGEVFITHTLGDLYRLQGHYQQAFEVYSRLLESCPDDSTLAVKLEDVAAQLNRRAAAAAKKPAPLPEPRIQELLEPVVAAAGRTEEEPVAEAEPIEAPALASDEGGGELSVDLRIDRIFSSVLHGMEVPPVRQSERNGAGSFVNMFERWIKGLKLLEAE
ncbi:tetratricopeptide repeat protein [bacterium]|nr:tetratricopeptide repeat protein [bacterium]